MLDAARAKARRGELRISVPIGYVWHRDMGLGFDPDIRLRQVIRLVFERFRQLGSARQTHLSLTAKGVFFPRPSDGKGHTRVFLRRLAWLIGFVGVLWVIQAVNWATSYALNPRFGLIPRQLSRLDGVVGMPFLHGSFQHLMVNTPPLLLLGTLLAATVTRALVAMLSWSAWGAHWSGFLGVQPSISAHPDWCSGGSVF
jgi:hypothetical protein